MPNIVYITVGLATEKEIDPALLNRIAEDAGKYAHGVLSNSHLDGNEPLTRASAHIHISNRRHSCEECRDMSGDGMSDLY